MYGIAAGCWFTHGGNIVDTPHDAAFAISEVEGPSDYEGVRAAIEADALPDCPLAIVTNHGGLIVKDSSGVTDIPASRALAKPLVDAGFACINELYLRTDDGRPTGKTAESMESIARTQLGFKKVSEAFGLFGGATRADYAEWFARPGNCDYVVENVLR